MKKSILTNTVLFITLLFLFNIVQSQDCTQCDNTTPPPGNYASEIGVNTTASGVYSFAGGINSTAQGGVSFAFGQMAQANGSVSFALGSSVVASNSNSFALGTFCTASGSQSFVLGNGQNSSTLLTNDIGYSLMIGFKSDKPTFFVGESDGAGTTGKIGIGNVTDPQAKLHIKADNNEDADLLLEPGSSMNYARVKFGTAGNRIDARGSQDLNFHTASDFVFWDANVGIGTHNPTAKLEITNGDIFISDIDHGIIMKSPDGQCWRGTVDNGGTLNFTAIDCNQLTITDNYSEPDGLKVTVYPNPSKDVITVKAEGTCADLSVTLKDINGSTVLTREIRNGKIKIRTAELPTGTYIVNIKSDGGECVHSEKVIIN